MYPYVASNENSKAEYLFTNKWDLTSKFYLVFGS